MRKVLGLRAEHCCEVRLDGAVVGLLLKGVGGCEYRGQAIGRDELEWVTGADSRDVVGKLMASLRGQVELGQIQR
jgi:hypothetical protein